MCAPYEGDRYRSKTLVPCSPSPLNFAEFGYLSKSVPEGLRSLFMAFEESAVRLLTAPHGAGSLPAVAVGCCLTYIDLHLCVGGGL